MAKYEKEKQVKKGKEWINAEAAGKEAKRVYSSIKGQKGSAFTKMAKDYLDMTNKIKDLKKLEADLKKNVELKMMEIFDDEADALFTRVAETSGVIAQIAKDAQKKTSKFNLEKFVQKMNESSFAPEIIEGLNCMMGECTDVKESISKGALKISLSESKLSDFLGKTSKGAISLIKSAFMTIKKKLSKTNKSLESKWDKLQNVISTLQREELKALNESNLTISHGLFGSLVLKEENKEIYTDYTNDLKDRIESGLREIRFDGGVYNTGIVSKLVDRLAPTLGISAGDDIGAELYKELLELVKTDIIKKSLNEAVTEVPDYQEGDKQLDEAEKQVNDVFERSYKKANDIYEALPEKPVRKKKEAKDALDRQDRLNENSLDIINIAREWNKALPKINDFKGEIDEQYKSGDWKALSETGFKLNKYLKEVDIIGIMNEFRKIKSYYRVVTPISNIIKSNYDMIKMTKKEISKAHDKASTISNKETAKSNKEAQSSSGDDSKFIVGKRMNAKSAKLAAQDIISVLDEMNIDYKGLKAEDMKSLLYGMAELENDEYSIKFTQNRNFVEINAAPLDSDGYQVEPGDLNVRSETNQSKGTGLKEVIKNFKV